MNKNNGSHIPYSNSIIEFGTACVIRKLILFAVMMVLTLNVQPTYAVDHEWLAHEGDLIVNGKDSGGTIADDAGELSVSYEVDGNERVGSASTTAETEVEHLSKIEFSDDMVSESGGLGETVVVPVGITNTGNGPDTYDLDGTLGLSQTGWDTQIYLDNGSPDFDTSVDVPVDRIHLDSLDSDTLFLAVGISDSSDQDTPDSFTVSARSIRTEDPTPGHDTVHFKVTTDTSSVVARSLVTGDTDVTRQQTIELELRSLNKVDTARITSEDTGTIVIDFEKTKKWKLAPRAGVHEISVKYFYSDGTSSDTVTDEIRFEGGKARIRLDKDVYRGIRDEATVIVQDTGASGSVNVLITSDLDKSGLKIKLEETKSGIFKGNFRFTQGLTRKDMIAVAIGSNVKATYESDGGTIAATAIWKQKAGTAKTVKDVRTWPNPYDPTTGKPLVFQNLPADRSLEIWIYNINSTLVRKLTLGDGIRYNPTGNDGHWFGKNIERYVVSSGTYIYVVKSKYGIKKGKITVLK